MIPPGLLSVASKIGWRGGAIIALGAGLAVQTVRLNITEAHLEACEAGREADRDAVRAAQAEAREQAVVAREAAEDQSEKLAEQRNAEHEQRRPAADRALRDYAVDRVRRSPAVGGGSGEAVATSEGGGSEVPVDLPADTIVATDYADLRICNELATYALDAHFFALDLEARNRRIEEEEAAWAEGLNAP